MTFRKIVHNATAGAALLSMVIPSIASAQTRVSIRPVIKADIRADVRVAACNDIGTQVARLQASVDKVRGNVMERRDERQGKLTERRDERAGKVDEHRESALEFRADAQAKLMARADTDAKKAAVTQYQTSVKAAVDARIAAYKTANDTFRSGVDAVVVARKTIVDNAVTAFRTSMNAALEKAKADCAAGVENATIHSDFNTSVQAARRKLQADRQGIDSNGDQVRALAKTRNDAHAKALATFKATMEKARADLKLAFGVKSE